METIFLGIIAFILLIIGIEKRKDDKDILEVLKEISTNQIDIESELEKSNKLLEKISYNTFNITKNTYKGDKKVGNY